MWKDVHNEHKSPPITTTPGLILNYSGSGCGAVGRAVASYIRGPGFESSHRQLLLNIYLLLTVCRKDENKEKEAGNGPFLKSILIEWRVLNSQC